MTKITHTDELRDLEVRSIELYTTITREEGSLESWLGTFATRVEEAEVAIELAQVVHQSHLIAIETYVFERECAPPYAVTILVIEIEGHNTLYILHTRPVLEALAAYCPKVRLYHRWAGDTGLQFVVAMPMRHNLRSQLQRETYHSSRIQLSR